MIQVDGFLAQTGDLHTNSEVNRMKQQQSGFTLIELVMVIVILGVLSAVAIPKFVNLKTDADAAATNGVAGALGSAMAINYAARSSNVNNGTAVTTCSSSTAS